MRNPVAPILTAMLLAVAVAAQAVEPSWGDLQARFVYDGVALKPPRILPGGNCVTPIIYERLLVNEQDNGIANVIVWLTLQPDDKFLDIHPDYDKTARDKVTVAMTGCRFEPHVSILRVSQTLVLANREGFGHNAKMEFFRNESFNDLVPAGKSLERNFGEAETAPSKLECSIHSWMSGYILLHNNPYGAVSDTSGNLKIAKLPVGKWTFAVWHEKSGFVKRAEFGGKPVEWERGRVTLDIVPGKNDLGEIKISPETLKAK